MFTDWYNYHICYTLIHYASHNSNVFDGILRHLFRFFYSCYSTTSAMLCAHFHTYCCCCCCLNFYLLPLPLPFTFFLWVNSMSYWWNVSLSQAIQTITINFNTHILQSTKEVQVCLTCISSQGTQYHNTRTAALPAVYVLLFFPVQRWFQQQLLLEC